MFKVLSKNDFLTTKWSGGTTRQLYIYPEESDFSKRDFLFRISVATTDIKETTFTKFEGMNRVISVLEGNMFLNHSGHYEKDLSPYDIDHFSGDWTTTSKGKVKDFNLILNKGVKGDFFFREIIKNEIYEIESLNSVSFIYCIEGKIDANDITLKEGQLLVFKSKNISYKSEKAKLFYGFIRV